MPTIQIEAELSSEQLLKAVEQMPQPELEKFVAQVIALRAQHQAPKLSRAESELLLRINEGIPADLQGRYDELIGKRRAAALSKVEHAELLRLTEQIEKLDAQRVGYLAELAQLRNMSLTALLNALGIRPPGNA